MFPNMNFNNLFITVSSTVKYILPCSSPITEKRQESVELVA